LSRRSWEAEGSFYGGKTVGRAEVNSGGGKLEKIAIDINFL
jgi:hypothetical protein